MADVLVTHTTGVAPLAGATVATTAALEAGVYTVTVVTVPIATVVAATDMNNVQLQVGATVLGTLTMAGTANVQWQNAPVKVNVPSATAILVTAVANASVAAVYTAQLVVSPIELY
jgi:hypothetical protein